MQTTFTNKIRNTINKIFAKLGYTITVKHEAEVNELFEKIAYLQHENRKLNSLLRYYKKNYKSFKENYKIADNLLSEAAVKQTTMPEKEVDKNTKKDHVGCPLGYSFADYPRAEREVRGSYRTYKKTGKTIYVESFTRQNVVKKAETA